MTNAAAEERKRSPLDAVHRRLGAKMGPFAGWEMPLEYAGTLSEHRAVRESVGIFDLTHLGKLEVRGGGAHDAVQHALSADLDRLQTPGAACMYSIPVTSAGNSEPTSSGAAGPCTASTATSGRGTISTAAADSRPCSSSAEARTASATLGQLAALGTSR